MMFVLFLMCYEQWGNEQGIHFLRVLSGMELLGYVIIQFYKIMLIVFQVGFNPFEFSAVFLFFSAVFLRVSVDCILSNTWYCLTS